MSSQRPILTSRSPGKMMSGDRRELGKSKASIWDAKVHSSQLTSCHTTVSYSLHRVFTHGLQKRVDRQRVSL